jgi:Flp pilus assembly protein TadD
LPSGSASLPPDRSTIAASVPPQVKVETVETKAQAQSAESKPATAGAATPIETPENAKATLVDTKPPEIEVPKLVDGKLPDAANAGAASPSDKATGRAPSQSDATRGRASSKSDATGRRAPSHSDAVPRGAAGSKSAPHPAAAVSLGPIPGSRDSKDVLAGWGWGTDKHDAITDGYADDDYDSDTQRSKKMLTYLIGGGLGLAALVTIVALAFGGSSNSMDTKAVAKQTETARPAIDQPSATAPGALDPAAQPAAAATAEGSAAAASADGSAAAANADGSAVTADGITPGAGSAAAVEGSAAQAEADRLAAENAEADRLAAENAEADRLAAEKAEADRVAAEKHAEAERIAADKQAKKEEATRLATEKAEARKAEAARVAAEKKAKKEEAARLAAEKAAARKAESARVAAERKAKREAAAQRAGTKSTAHAKTARKTVASAESKGDAQAAYRTGIQQYARGDTSGALASLRKALAANPSYAPTWRGLGLVYEKMGEKAQARAAYKRYLQLAPSAGDAAQIRGRLERLGS